MIQNNGTWRFQSNIQTITSIRVSVTFVQHFDFSFSGFSFFEDLLLNQLSLLAFGLISTTCAPFNLGLIILVKNGETVTGVDGREDLLKTAEKNLISFLVKSSLCTGPAKKSSGENCGYRMRNRSFPRTLRRFSAVVEIPWRRHSRSDQRSRARKAFSSRQIKVSRVRRSCNASRGRSSKVSCCRMMSAWVSMNVWHLVRRSQVHPASPGGSGGSVDSGGADGTPSVRKEHNHDLNTRLN